jgi:hypothetical protein
VIHSRPSKRIDPLGPLALFREFVRVPQTVHLDPVWDDLCFTPDLPDPLKRFPDIQVDGPISRYLGWSQHDGQVIGWGFDRSSARLTINHHDIWQLASVIDEANCRSLRKAFPVTIEFCEVESLEIVRYVEQGAVQKIRTTIKNIAHGLIDIRAIRCIGVAPKQTTFLIVAHGGRRGFRRSKKVFANPFEDTYYIAVACRSVQVHEHYRNAWERLLGKGTLRILDAFGPVWPNPSWGACEFEAWLFENFQI